MFDLIDECGKDLKSYGYKIKMLDKFGISEATLAIKTEKDSHDMGLAVGEYYIFNSPFVYELYEGQDYLSELLSRTLKKILKKKKLGQKARVLICCLGNPDIMSDRLGKEVFDNIPISPLEKSNHIFKFCPNIFFSTGIDTLSMVKLFTDHLKIEYVIIIDSLTTSQLSRLGTSFQITTNGMTPGSGVNRFGKRISKESIGKPCISIGVPFMIFSSSLKQNEEVEIVLTSKDVRENVVVAGKIIAQAINEVVL